MMIKFILPNNEQYFHKFNSNISIKENLNDFCKEKGLVPDIYEVYDPIYEHVLDGNKKILDYDLNSLHLRRVNSSFSSLQSCQDLPYCTNTSDKLWNDQTIRTYSQNSYNQIQMLDNNIHKKTKKGFMYQLKKYMPKKEKNMSRSFSESLESPVEKEMITLSTDKIYQGSLATEIIQRELLSNQKNKKKKKRNAPLPPMKNTLTFYFDENSDSKLQSIDLEIPLPPIASSEMTDNINYYPWQSCNECFTGQSDEDEFIYSIISEDPLPLSPGFNIFETPMCPTPKEISDDGRESPEHTYSTISKMDKQHSSIGKSNSSSSSSENLDGIDQHHTNTKIQKDKLMTIASGELSNCSGSPVSFHVQELSISDNKTILTAPVISMDSDGSSISSLNNDTVVEIHKDYESQPPKTNFILKVSSDKSKTNIGDNSNNPQLYSTDYNSKTEEISFPKNDKQENNSDILLPTTEILILPEKNLSKTLHNITPYDHNIRNANTDENLDETDSKKIQKSIPPKPHFKPRVIINNCERKDVQIKKRNNKPKNSPAQPFYDDGNMIIEKQGQSLFFSVKPKP